MGFGGVNIFGARKQKKPKDKTSKGFFCLFVFILFCLHLYNVLAFVIGARWWFKRCHVKRDACATAWTYPHCLISH